MHREQQGKEKEKGPGHISLLAPFAAWVARIVVAIICAIYVDSCSFSMFHVPCATYNDNLYNLYGNSVNVWPHKTDKPMATSDTR